MNKRATLEEIAGGLVTPDATDDTSPKSDDDAALAAIMDNDDDGAGNIDDDIVEGDDEGEGVDLLDDDDLPQDGGENEDEDDDTAGGAEDGPEILPIEDTDTIDVVVDGEVQTFTIADAKKALSGEGAIEKRLQEATLERNKAREDRELGLTQVRKQYNVLHQAVGHLSQVLFAPHAKEPDQNLLNTDLQAYQKQDIAYRKDQERIQMMQQQVGQLFGAITEQINQDLQQVRAQEKAELHKALPILKDPEKGKVARQDILEAAAHYGFSEREIAEAYDSRVFRMAYDAAQYRKSLVSDKTEVKTGKRKRKNAPRVMRHGSTTAKTKARTNAKRATAVKQRAAETGKVDDIAAAILQPARRKRR